VTPVRYQIAVGRAGLETAAGRYKIVEKIVNPPWHVPTSAWDLAGQTIAAGDPQNPLKARWLGFHDGQGIHGTDDVASLGSAASAAASAWRSATSSSSTSWCARARRCSCNSASGWALPPGLAHRDCLRSPGSAFIVCCAPTTGASAAAATPGRRWTSAPCR
jgi:hypothetical protein